MADLGTNILASLLLGAEKDALAESPFAPLSGAADLVGKTLIQASPNFSTKDNMLAGLITGLVGGGTDFLSQQYANKQTGMLNDLVQGQAANPGSIFEKPGDLSDSLWNKAEAAQSIFEIENRQNIAAERRASQAALGKEIFNSALDNPEKTSRNLGVMGYGGTQTPGIEPGSMDALLQKHAGNTTAAEAEFKRTLEAPDLLKARRDEFTKLPEVQVFKLADTGFKSMQKAFDDPMGTSDVELTRAAIQAIEPGLAVRMDDQQAIEQAPSIPAAWKAKLSGALEGKSQLDDGVRKGLMRIAARRYNEHAKNFNLARSFYMRQAEKENLDPTGITPYGEAALSNLERFGLSDDASGTPGQAPPSVKSFSPAPGVKILTAPDGTQKTYHSVNGQWVAK